MNGHRSDRPSGGTVVRDMPGRASGACRSALQFHLIGSLGDRSVNAFMAGGVLLCDSMLYSHAALFVDLGERFEAQGWEPMDATLSGSSLAVLVTLLQAIDSVDELTVEVGSPSAG